MLEELFNKYHSDKGTKIGPKHSYADFYEKYLDPIKRIDKTRYKRCNEAFCTWYQIEWVTVFYFENLQTINTTEI